MPFQLSPGVLSVEKDYSIIAPAVAVSAAAYTGSFQWGPVEDVETVSNEKKLLSKFFKPNNDTAISFFSAATFLSYSNNLKVVRVVGDLARNAVAGGKGSGLTLDTTVINGQISSVSVNSAGTGYQVGDIVTIDNSSLSNAVLRVIDITNETGAVTASGLTILDNGTGYESVTGETTTANDGVVVKNLVDFEDSVNLPEVIGRYPGVMGNSLMLSTARASEFDNWEYKNRFIVPPVADTVTFDGTGSKKIFDIDGALASDAVVTVDGLVVENGTNAGQYQSTTSTITFNTDSETFSPDGATDEFTLINADSIATNGYVVDIDATVYEHYTGSGDVPFGKVQISGNTLTFGLNKNVFSGNSVTKTFNIVGVTGITDARVKVDGVARTVVAIAPADNTEVQVVTNGSNTDITFHSTDVPAIGNNNIVVDYGFPTGTTLTVEYGFPVSGSSNIKVFTNQTEVHAIVADQDGEWTGEKGSILERYEFLSLVEGTKNQDGSIKYYVDKINKSSRYVWIGSPITEHGDKVLDGGVDDNAFADTTGVTPGKLQIGYDLYKNKNEHDIAHVITGHADSATTLHCIQNISEYREDCVTYLSPKFSDVVNNKGQEMESCISTRGLYPSSSYACMDSNWMSVYDKYNDVYRWIPTNAAVAGAFAATAEKFEAWLSGAGLVRGRIKNASKLAWNPDQTDMDELYPRGINPVINLFGEGPVLYGDKTMQSMPSAFDHMNVRFLFIVLKKSISRMAKYFLFENNTQFTRNRFKNGVNPFLRTVKGRDGVEEYLVVSTEDNNPIEVRQRNEFVGDILVKPVYSINFITLNFVAVGGDVTFEEIIRSN